MSRLSGVTLVSGLISAPVSTLGVEGQSAPGGERRPLSDLDPGSAQVPLDSGAIADVAVVEFGVVADPDVGLEVGLHDLALVADLTPSWIIGIIGFSSSDSQDSTPVLGRASEDGAVGPFRDLRSSRGHPGEALQATVDLQPGVTLGPPGATRPA